jgi:hypothetical protein
MSTNHGISRDQSGVDLESRQVGDRGSSGKRRGAYHVLERLRCSETAPMFFQKDTNVYKRSPPLFLDFRSVVPRLADLVCYLGTPSNFQVPSVECQSERG